MSDDLSVLHIDDEPDFAETAASFLEREYPGLKVETSTYPPDALELIDRRDYDCVIADYAMPEYDGVELIETIREDYPDLPIIIYTGKGSEEVASAAISKGVTDYVLKQSEDDLFQVLADRVNDAIEQQQARVNYEQIFEKIPDGIVIHDADTFEFVDMNRKYADMYGYDSKEEFLEAGFESIHFGEEPYTMEKAREHVRNAIEEGPQTFEWHVVRKDGTDFWADVHLATIQLNGNERILAVVRDVTNRHEYEREIEETNERLDEFASIVSHDLRNPLTVAEGNLELVQEDVDHQGLEAIERAHKRMRDLIDDLLLLTRGQASIQRQRLSLSDLVEECWQNVQSESSTLEINSERQLRADRSRLLQLLENLFRNAVEHAGERPTVTVGDLDEGFFVEDDGPGIPEQQREEVFELGYTTRREGTGYGLNIVQEIVEEHGWKIEVTESAAGGARFEIKGVEEVP